MNRSSSILLGVLAVAVFAMPAQAQESYMADLTGEAEVPGPGDPDGAGIATLDWNTMNEELCYALAVDYVDPATAAHVHRGVAGENGPPVITLETPGIDGGSDGCVEISNALRTELRENPSGFYVNVHNDAYPAGAVRGQLER
ncbi:CHRD domain-containing protein [Parasphingopyxis algicola]|uniref:CHRD domain-containing protein n=1 Tax=Parasphingopyxis algicola TaxID=2026624 RepID=UPI00159F7ABA|nr:CHRD domain-containing protein [Parasphingopyxis algicola]QLC25930.1 CHRD domain-containing protein [Parasphingopyxis algicola]